MQDTKRAFENTEGTGLGLSISKSLAEAFGGTIGTDSTPGEGASFWFTVPVKILQPAPGTTRPPLSERAVMLIKTGDPKPADAFGAYFRSRGARVVEADGIEAALTLARQENGAAHPFDLALFIDGDGAGPDRWPPISVASELRGHHTLFVIYTPVAASNLWRRALGSGAAALIDQHTTDACLDRNVEQILGIAAQANDRADVKEDSKVQDTSVFVDKKVLVLEDRLVNQTVISRQLKTLNIACTIVGDGLLGLEALASGTYDVILCDCSMPRMNGYDFTRALRQREEERKDGSHIPVIAMTANAFREDMEKCFAAGMDDFVSKPVTLDRLSTVLAHWLGKSQR
jgi:CheY-like chemotaxis protein